MQREIINLFIIFRRATCVFGSAATKIDLEQINLFKNERNVKAGKYRKEK